MIKRKLIIIFIFFSLNNISANIVYDKNQILVTDIEIDQFKILYKEYYDLELNNSQILKKIILNKDLINKIKVQNIEYYEYLNEITNEHLNNAKLSETERYFFQYYFLRREFTIEYFKNNLKLSDIEEALSMFPEIKVPLSLNDCITVSITASVKKNNDFIRYIYENFKNRNSNSKINFNDKSYSICLSKNTSQLIENNLVKIIEKNTDKNFNKFVYEKTNKK